MLTARSVIISPFLRRSSMNRVVTMVQVGTHDPRWSGRWLSGTGAGPGVVASTAAMVVIGPPPVGW